MKKVLALTLLSGFLLKEPVYSFENCYSLFENERYLESFKCMQGVPEYFSPYKDYFSLLSADITDLDILPLEKKLQKEDNFAISHYAFLYLAKKYLNENLYKSYLYIRKVDPKALKEEDIPFYLHLKSQILKEKGFIDEAEKIEKKLALKYPYDRFYGYKTLLKLLPSLVDEEIFQAIDSLLKKRMPKRASYLLSYIDESPKKDYYRIRIYSKLKKYKTVKKLLAKIDKNHPFYKKLLGYKVSYAYGKKKKVEILNEMKKLGLKEKANKIARGYMRSAFYKRDNKSFYFYASLIDNDSKVYSDKAWFTFLNKYRSRDYLGAYLYLSEKQDVFSKKEKNKIYYWLYLTLRHINKSKAFEYLYKASNSDYTDFYKVLAQEKIKIRKVSFKLYKPWEENVYLDKNFRLIEYLKNSNLYDYAYLEADYIRKKSKDFDTYLKLSVVFPEKTAWYFSKKHFRADKAYPKPFADIEKDNLVYAVMRQESFFNKYALSYSNAVGLMQIMPSTGRWIAKKLGDKDYSPYKLFEHERNIRYGKWFLDYLLKIFKGNKFYAIAAYNGGGVIVRKTIKKNRITDPAEFVEFMPYLQTRNYVKKVYTNYVIYKQLEKENVYRAYRRSW